MSKEKCGVRSAEGGARRIVLDAETVHRIAEEARINQNKYEAASNSLDRVTKAYRQCAADFNLLEKEIIRRNAALTAMNEFLRSLYLIGVAGVTRTSGGGFKFDLDAALAAAEGCAE